MTDIPRPVQVDTTIERQRVAKGTKSDRTALVAMIDGRLLVLRRRGEPAFSEDAELAGLDGETVTLLGTPLATTFLVDEARKR